jgi:hypothetical protein
MSRKGRLTEKYPVQRPKLVQIVRCGECSLSFHTGSTQSRHSGVQKLHASIEAQPLPLSPLHNVAVINGWCPGRVDGESIFARIASE